MAIPSTIKLRILGTGTSTGVPTIGCQCPVCTSTDPRDRRLRTSALVRTPDANILIDCGPDFRQQILPVRPFERIDAVLITHEHYDHVGGLDDLRPFCQFGEIPVYANELTAKHLCNRMPYCFITKKYPGIPRFDLRIAQPGRPFLVNQTEVVPINVMHGKLPILGFRIGQRVGYITDMKWMPDESYDLMAGVELLIINTLRPKAHPTHMTFAEALQAASRIGAKQTYFVHMCHQAGLHAEIDRDLPPGIHFAYDGLTLQV